MKNKIAFIDIDGTLIKGQSQKYFITFLRKKGFLNFADSLVIYSWFTLYKLGVLNNSKWILNFTLRKFKGVESAYIDSLMDEFYDSVLRNKLYRYSKVMIETLVKSGIEVVMLSSAVEPIVRIISKELNSGGDYICTLLEKDNFGKFTGRISGQHIYSETKTDSAVEYLQGRSIDSNNTIIISDHYSDKNMLKNFKNSIIANPDTNMRIWASKNKMPVIYFNKHESVQYLESYIKS